MQYSCSAASKQIEIPSVPFWLCKISMNGLYLQLSIINHSEITMAKKENRIIITLECTEARKEGLTPSRYTTTKNKKNNTERLILKKYNPYLKRHTPHKEIK